MPEPVNPEDHSIDDRKWTSAGEFAYGQSIALTEAIHQTFERDAEGVVDDREYSSHIKTRQPVFEIDRLARLIVDGEYRRRSQQKEPTQ